MNTYNEEERNHYNYNMQNMMPNMNYNDMNYPEMMNQNYQDYDNYQNEYDYAYKQDYKSDQKYDYKEGYKGLSKNLYDPMEGLLHGNMFPQLFKGYKHHKVYKIEPMNEQAHMLTTVDALQFAMQDIVLYLDMAPDDKDMLNLYDEYKNEAMKAIHEYEEKYGPLFTTSPAMKHDWTWAKTPWPWEV